MVKEMWNVIEYNSDKFTKWKNRKTEEIFLSLYVSNYGLTVLLTIQGLKKTYKSEILRM